MLVFALIGYFLVRAAIDYDPDKAIGLDGALAALRDASYGPFLLGVVAAGLIGVRRLLDRGRALPEGVSAWGRLPRARD